MLQILATEIMIISTAKIKIQFVGLFIKKDISKKIGGTSDNDRILQRYLIS